MDEGPLITGIAALGPGQKRVLLWGTFDEIMAGTRGKPVKITSTFKRLESSFGLSDELEPVGSVLEVESLKHNELRFEDGSWECAKQLAEIANSRVNV